MIKKFAISFMLILFVLAMTPASFSAQTITASKVFDALDWLAQLVTHVPNKGEQMVRYYGFYSNKLRGLRKKAGTDNQVPALMESEISSKEFRMSWARLIQKIYNINPLLCPKCLGSMRKISFIEDEEIIKNPTPGKSAGGEPEFA